MSTVIPPHDISLSKATLVGAWVEGPLYGLSIALYAVYFQMLKRDSEHVQKNILLGAATLQLIIGTIHYIASLLDLMSGFLTHVQGPGGSDAYFANSTHPVFIIQLFCYFTNYMIGDALVAWRCYILWQHNVVVGVVFLVLLTGSFVSVYSTVGHIANLAHLQNLFDVKSWATSIFAISLAIQIIATILIVQKILGRTMRTPFRGHKQDLAVMWTIVESGVILTATSVTLLTLYTLNMNAGAIISPIIGQLSFLVPTSIFIRVRMKRDARSKAQVIPLYGYTRNTTGAASRSHGESEVESSGVGDTAVTVRTEIETKVDDSLVPEVQSHV